MRGTAFDDDAQSPRLLSMQQAAVSFPCLTGEFPEGGPAAFVVLDHAERLAGGNLLASLLATRQMTGALAPRRPPRGSVLSRTWQHLQHVRACTGASVNWVLVSEHGWGSGAFMHDTLHLRRPAEVHFPAYQQSQLLNVRFILPLVKLATRHDVRLHATEPAILEPCRGSLTSMRLPRRL